MDPKYCIIKGLDCTCLEASQCDISSFDFVWVDALVDDSVHYDSLAKAFTACKQNVWK